MKNVYFLDIVLLSGTTWNLFILFCCLAPNSFLIVAQKTTFYRVVMDIDDSSDSSLPVVGLKNVKAVEYDPLSQMIYWVKLYNIIYFQKVNYCFISIFLD